MLPRSSHAERATVLISGHRRLISAMHSRPSRPGMRRSSSTRSGARRPTSASSSSPERASPTTSMPSLSSSARRMPCSTSGWSSAIRTFSDVSMSFFSDVSMSFSRSSVNGGVGPLLASPDLILDLTRIIGELEKAHNRTLVEARPRPSSRCPPAQSGYQARTPAPILRGTTRLDLRSMAGLVKTEAIVLRSLRYGEADRILRLYTLDRGHVGAIAKGVRRASSRFGGRLEPFFRLRIELHEGRGELATVTGAQTLAGHPHLRADARAIDAAARACDAVGRLFDTSEGHPAVYHLLSRALALLDERARERSAPDADAGR